MNTQQLIPDARTAVVILAAGSSSRLGKPKQLLQYQNQTLIKHTVKTALQTAHQPVIVVTGFLHEELLKELENLPVQFIHNPFWEEGMGSSIRTGIKLLDESENSNQIHAALILLSDQPLITAEHLKQLTAQFYSDKRSIVTCTSYTNVKGAPAVFDRSLFAALQNLPGNRGAQWLFEKYQDQLTVVPFEGGAIDVDTEEDYLRLLKSEEDKQE